MYIFSCFVTRFRGCFLEELVLGSWTGDFSGKQWPREAVFLFILHCFCDVVSGLPFESS